MNLQSYDYQPVVDMLVKLGDQLNRPNYRFLKGDVIAMAIEKATKSRLKYEDAVGYDSVDQIDGVKYEIKSVHTAFSKKGKISGKINLSNTYKVKNPKFEKTFDYLLVVQSDPKNFAIAMFDWETCKKNSYFISGQFNLKTGLSVKNWVCKDNTEFRYLEPVKLNIRKLLETVL